MTRNFLGIEIIGNVTPGRRIPQRPQAELTPIIQAVLDDPTIAEFGWTQYTPYFNDGEPCEFRAGGAWARLVDDPEPDEDAGEQFLIDESYERLGVRPQEWDRAIKEWVYGDYEGPDEERYDRLMELHKAIGSDAFDDVLLSLFGDHCEVTFRRDGIQVDFYHHD